MFYDGSNWLIAMRGGVGLQKESLQISDYQIVFTALLLLRVLFEN